MPTTAMIFDIAILVILLVFAIRGASRGLLLSLCSLVAVVVAFIGASFVSDFLAPKAAELIAPPIQQAITQALDAQDFPDGGDWSDDLLSEFLEDSDLPKVLIQPILDAYDSAGGPLGITESVAHTVAVTLAHGILFLLAFVVILILWTVLSHALDLVTRLPGLNTLNRTGGALLGLLKGGVLLFLCAWAVNTFWPVIPKETVEQTRLLSFFLNTNPVMLLLSALPAGNP